MTQPTWFFLVLLGRLTPCLTLSSFSSYDYLVCKGGYTALFRALSITDPLLFESVVPPVRREPPLIGCTLEESHKPIAFLIY